MEPSRVLHSIEHIFGFNYQSKCVYCIPWFNGKSANTFRILLSVRNLTATKQSQMWYSISIVLAQKLYFEVLFLYFSLIPYICKWKIKYCTCMKTKYHSCICNTSTILVMGPQQQWRLPLKPCSTTKTNRNQKAFKRIIDRFLELA